MLTLREQKNVRSLSRAQLRRIQVVTPERDRDTSRWKGIQHGELADTIVKGLQERAVTIKDECWYVGRKDDAHLTGSLKITVPKKKSPKGMDFSLGVHHGNDMSYALKFAVGTHIHICENGMVSGDIALKKLHTKGFNLVSAVGDGLDQFLNQLDNVGSFIESLKAIDISDQARDEVLMEAGRQGLLPWSRIGKVDKEFRKPTFAAFNQRNAWGLYNAFTYIIQKSPAHDQISGMSEFKDMLLKRQAT
jgi:hypothetical protein